MSNNEVMTWAQAIDVVAPKFNQIATAQNLVTWAEESQFAMQAIQKSEHLAKCSVHTTQNAIINVAAVGLTLNPALGYAYLVPEGGECNLKVSFKGLLKIATDSGSILWAKAEIVKAKDEFEYLGICTLPIHKMKPFEDRGDTVGVYCVAKTHQGDFLVDYMGMEDITKVKNAAKTKTVWTAWPDEMIKKAMIKRASKQWPKTDRMDHLDRAIAIVNEYEGSEDLPMQERDITPKQPEAPAERQKVAITDSKLAEVVIKIQNGETNMKRLLNNHFFTVSQKKVLTDTFPGVEI